MENFGKICFIVKSMIITTILGGFIFSLLWLWFVVPVFHLQILTIAQAIGLSFFISYIKLNPNNKSNDNDKKEFFLTILNQTITTITLSILILALGYLLKICIY
jgi:hypothetical protein